MSEASIYHRCQVISAGVMKGWQQLRDRSYARNAMSTPLRLFADRSSLQFASQTLNPTTKEVTALEIKTPAFFQEPVVIYGQPSLQISAQLFALLFDTYVTATS
jgi:hypothetical protein